MTRRRYVERNGEWVEVPLDYTQDAPKADALLWNDRLYQDDGDKRYTSRKTHREYMKQNDLSTADDWTDTWAKAAKEREDIRKGVDPQRREAVLRALYAEQKRRTG